MAQDLFEQLHAAVKQAESQGKRFDEKGNLLTSPKGAQGEMQVMPKTQLDPGYGVTPAKGLHPDEIARVGKDYLKAMVDKYGDTQKALIAYNWGPGNTDKWLAKGADPSLLPAETQKYVKDITGMLGGKKMRVSEASDVQDLAKNAGPGYKAALAMMFLADDKPEKDDEDIWKEAEAPVEEETAQPDAFAGLDLGYKSPFPVAQAPAAQQLAQFARGGVVHRADGSPETGELTPEEIAAASKPAFITPGSGRNRQQGPISQALNSGEAYPAMVRGAGDVAYDIVGGPVDLATMALRPFGYKDEKPVMGSDWIKEKMTKYGIRPGDEATPTLQGFRTLGELGASVVNPGPAVARAGQTVEKGAATAADMLRRVVAPNTEARAAAAQAAHAERVAQAEETMRRAVPVQIDLPFPTPAAAAPVEEVRQVAIPKAEPVAPPVAQPVVEAPATIGGTNQPFVGRLDTFVSSLKGPVTKEQFLNQLKGKFRDYDLQRAETVLSDLGAADKITPAQLTERLSANFSPRDFRIAVHSPEENKYGSFFQGMDNPFAGHKGKNMGVIALLQNNTPERIAAHENNLKVESALSNLTSQPILGSFIYTEKDVPTVLKYLEDNPQAVTNPKEAKEALEKAQKYFQIALDRQNEIKSVVSAYKYPATHPNWSGYVDEAAAAARASGDSSYHFQLMDRANQRVWDEANQWLKKHNIKPPSEEMLTSSGYSDLNKYLEDKLDPLMKEAQVARNKVVNYVKPYVQEIHDFQKQNQLYGGDPMHFPLTKQIQHYDPVSFSRFTEHTLPMDDGTEVKGIFLHELQSDRMDDLVKKGPKGGSREKDLAELAKIKEGMQNIRAASAGQEPNLAVDAHIMDQAVRIAKLDKDSKTEAARHLYTSYPDKRETITEAFKLANRENELNRRAYSANYSLPESFAGMETNKPAAQQLMLKTAITAAMQRGDNFVAFPVTYGAGKSAQAQLYERLPYNLKQVIKDMGGEKMGFYTKQVKLPIDDATDATTTAVFWGPATRDHVMKTGVPFAKGGSVERVSDDNRRYL